MNHQDHRPITLSQSPNGQVKLCRECQQGITVEFGHIRQLFAREDFLQLEYNLRCLCAAHYFRHHPGQAKIVLSTSVPDLFFAFTETEFVELQSLLGHGLGKLHLIESAARHPN